MVLKKFGNACLLLRDTEVEEYDTIGGRRGSGSLEKMADMASESELRSAPITPVNKTKI